MNSVPVLLIKNMFPKQKTDGENQNIIAVAKHKKGRLLHVGDPHTYMIHERAMQRTLRGNWMKSQGLIDGC